MKCQNDEALKRMALQRFDLRATEAFAAVQALVARAVAHGASLNNTRAQKNQHAEWHCRR
jgi:hypothetical protein